MKLKKWLKNKNYAVLYLFLILFLIPGLLLPGENKPKKYKGFSVSIQGGGSFIKGGDFNELIRSNTTFYLQVSAGYKKTPFFWDARMELEYSLGPVSFGLETGHLIRSFDQLTPSGLISYRYLDFSAIPILANIHVNLFADEDASWDIFAGGGVYWAHFKDVGEQQLYQWEHKASQISPGFQFGTRLQYNMNRRLILFLNLHYQFVSFNKMTGEGTTNAKDPYFQSYEGDLQFSKYAGGYSEFVLLGWVIGNHPAEMHLTGPGLTVGLKWLLKKTN